VRKVVDVVMERAFDGFCDNVTSLESTVCLYSDLNLNQDIYNLIISRVEMVLNVNILQSKFNKKSTLGDFRRLVENVYVEKYRR